MTDKHNDDNYNVSFWQYYKDAVMCRNKHSLSWAAIPVSWITIITIGILIYSIVIYLIENI